MANINVTEDEAQLVAMFRAIKEFDSQLVNVGEVGDMVNGLKAVIDDEKLSNLNASERKALLFGFVGGVAAMKLTQEPQYAVEPAYLTEDDTYYTGGPSGGVAVGQGEDPKYVHQTGPREDQLVKSD